MEIAKIQVNGVKANRLYCKDIPHGIIGAQVEFEFDSTWQGLRKTVVFRGCCTKDVLDAGDIVTIPAEVVANPGVRLSVGVYGTNGDGTLVIPTIWAELGVVRYAADPSGDASTDPTLPVWAQIQAAIGKMEDLDTADKSTLVAAVNEILEKGGSGGVDAAEVERIVEEYMEKNPPAPGNDYVLTEDDKQEIAEMTAELVKVPDSGGNVDYVGVEPAEDDIPKIFFGGALQQTKDEAVVPFRYISKTDDFSGYAEIKAQGNSSMNYAKKNQTVKMFADEACETKLKKDFKGWGKQNKHVYKANWIDLTHARNVVSARLWADVVKSRANYAELPELLRTSPNHGAVDGFPVKVYADGVYQGRYTLNIPKDKWTFNMDDELDEHCVLCGENYASGCFRASAQINESDWTDEIHDVVPTSIKTRWNEVISFVMNSTDDDFRANLSQYFYVDSLIDYYLFGLASCGLDAFGKNQIYATYDGQRWIASMYDMDSTWGLYWNGSKFVSTSYDRNEYEDMVQGRQGNLLYIRLEQLFYEELQTRWAELKNGALSIVNVINRFERFTDIAPESLVKEDYASTTGNGAFTAIPSQSTNNIQQIRAFALARQAWTDEYVAGLNNDSGGNGEDESDGDEGNAIPCTGISLDKNELTFNGDSTQTIMATVTPSDTTNAVVWASSAPTVAYITIEGNVCTVRGMNNGNAVITVTCGNYSATCEVTVSGFDHAYRLPEATTFNGTSDYIDTGVPLFDTDKDFSIFVDYVGSENNADTATVIASMREASPWPGFALRVNSTAKHCVVGSANLALFSKTERAKTVITHKAGSNNLDIIASNGSEIVRTSLTFNKSVFSETVLLGCAYTSSGGHQRYWTGTMYACEIYNRVLDNEEIGAKTGVVTVAVDGFVWGNTATSAVDKSTGEVISGKNYVTTNVVEVPNNVMFEYRNVGTGAFTWLGYAEYDANMTFIKYVEPNSNTNPVSFTLSENAKYLRLGAYPNTSVCTDPANQLILEYTCIAE